MKGNEDMCHVVINPDKSRCKIKCIYKSSTKYEHKKLQLKITNYNLRNQQEFSIKPMKAVHYDLCKYGFCYRIIKKY